MQLIRGKPIAEKLLQRVADRIQSRGVTPGLAVVLVGDDPASEIYVGLKEKAAQSVSVHFEKHVLPVDTTTAEAEALVRSLNSRADIHGIIVQLPLPDGIDADAVIATIRPDKDADGFHPETVSQFLSGAKPVPPVFPRAILALLESTGVPLGGKQAIIFANSRLFSQVMATALGRVGIQSATSLDLDPEETSLKLTNADVVISAKGDPHFLTGDQVRSGAIVIDGGITRVGELVMSDADPETFQDVEGYITPVPGGVGPVTVALLIARTTELALGEPIEGSIL